MSEVAVLFARADSVYKTIPGCDVWDIDRDARKWPGGAPVVAHPPCRAWGRLSHMAKPRPDEKDLARWAAAQVREWGGVLEHPNGSRLWEDQALGSVDRPDAWGGWTLPISQCWWGHRAEKRTKLYIVGVDPGDIPSMPYELGNGTHVIAQDTRKGNGGKRLQKGDLGWRPFVTHAEREHTPPELAHWLVNVARLAAKQAA